MGLLAACLVRWGVRRWTRIGKAVSGKPFPVGAKRGDAMGRLRFGVLTFPIHRPTHNPTLQLEGDLVLAELCDRLGFEEFWFGEHHSGGWQIIGSPELMIAAAAQRTSRIRLGTGVSTLSYHHPLTLLDRIIQLDHMTRGRLIFGVGAG